MSIEAILKGGGAVAAGLAAEAAKQSGKRDLRDLRTSQAGLFDQIERNVRADSQFKPFTVTSGAGTTQLNQGSLNLSPNQLQSGLQAQAQQQLGGLGQPVAGLQGLGEQAFQQSQQALGMDSGAFTSGLGGMYGAMGEQQLESASQDRLGGLTGAIQQQALGMLGNETPTAESVYNQIRAMQTPEEERQRIALENRLAAQGRLGVTTNAFGGTPEQFALEKAQAEARNQASLQALQMSDQLASSEQARQAQLAQLGGQLAQTGAGIEAQQQQLGQGLLGLGLKAQELGGQLNYQDAQTAGLLANIGQQATALPTALEQAQLANITQSLNASGIPLQQQLAVAQMGLGAQQAEAARQQNITNLLANLGLSETGLMKDLGMTEATLSQEFIKSLGNIGAGLAGIEI